MQVGPAAERQREHQPIAVGPVNFFVDPRIALQQRIKPIEERLGQYRAGSKIAQSL